MDTSALEDVLIRARARGLLGPAPVGVHVRHGQAFALAMGGEPSSFLDLGTGAGVPGLVLLFSWPRTTAVLLDSSRRKMDFVSGAIRELGLGERAVVIRARAEEAAREDSLRGRFPLVVARGFGRPAVTAECGAPFLRTAGRLVVSEPPASTIRGGPGESAGLGQAQQIGAEDDEDLEPSSAGRWIATGLARVGLVDAGMRVVGSGTFHVLVQARPCPARFPRRVGIPAKRPLF